MGNVRENCAVRTTYRVMRLSGVVTRSLCEGFYFIVPFMRPDEVEAVPEEEPAFPAKEKADEITRRIPERAEAGAEITPVKKTVRDAELKERLMDKEEILEKSEREIDDTDGILKGIDFDSRLQQMETGVYVKDARSKLASVRKKALQEIRNLPKALAIRILQKLLRVEDEPLRVIEILNALSALNDDGRVGKALFMDLVNDKSPAVRLAALRSVSKYKDEESFSILSASLKDADAEIRRQALNLLCWEYGKKSTSSVMMMLHDVDNRIRRTAISISGSLKLRQAISPLISFLSDPDKEIQKRAAGSLRKSTGQDFEFKASGSAKSRKEAIELWRFWWRDNQAKFGM